MQKKSSCTVFIYYYFMLLSFEAVLQKTNNSFAELTTNSNVLIIKLLLWRP